jgi:hypothetical protein
MAKLGRNVLLFQEAEHLLKMAGSEAEDFRSPNRAGRRSARGLPCGGTRNSWRGCGPGDRGAVPIDETEAESNVAE